MSETAPKQEMNSRDSSPNPYFPTEKALEAKKPASGAPVYHSILHLQRIIGNQAVLHLLRSEGKSSLIQRDPKQPNQQRDEFIRQLAKRPSYALNEWKRLSPEEQVLLVRYMSENYDESFARRFQQYARMPHRPEMVAETTDQTEYYTPERLRVLGYRKYGYFYFGATMYTDYWVHPSGNEIWVMHSGSAGAPVSPEPKPQPTEKALENPTDEASANTKPQPPDVEEINPENPTQLDLDAEPETIYGPVKAHTPDFEMWGETGDATLYEDGTIEFFSDTSGMLTLRPRISNPDAYEIYESNGQKRIGWIRHIRPEYIEKDFGTSAPR